MISFILLVCVAIATADTTESTIESTTELTTETTTESTTEATVESTTESTIESTVESTTESESTTTTTLTPTTVPTPPIPPNFTKCTSDRDCSGTTPYCEPRFGVCQACLTNYDCRAKQRCNAECWVNNFGERLCRTPVGQTRVACLKSEVCYITKGLCAPSCIPSGSEIASTGSTKCDNREAFSFLVGNLCNPADGRCYYCLSDSDCNGTKNATCGSTCTTSQLAEENVCSSTTACTTSENCLRGLSTSTYSCVKSSGTFLIPSLLFLGLIAIITF